jgi:hypothetical protein
LKPVRPKVRYFTAFFSRIGIGLASERLRLGKRLAEA